MPILMYHRIADEGPAGLARWRLPPAEFERQMAWLAAAGYRSMTLRDWQGDDPESASRAIVLTFDDAYLDFLTTALPILHRYGFGATMFVPTGFVGGSADWDRDFGSPAPLMSWEELRSLPPDEIEFGAHTVSHRRLTGLDDRTVEAELRDSRTAIERELGTRAATFAYPYGDHDDRVDAIVEAAGFALAVTTAPKTTSPFAVGRIEICGTDPIEVFAGKVGGG